MKNTRAVDTLNLVFIFALLSITIFFRKKLPDKDILIAIYSSLIVVQVLLILLNNKVPRAIHDFIFPLIYVLAIFDSLGRLVHYINPVDIDPVLIRLDYLIFGGHPTVLLERIINPFLTEVFQLSYTTYYFIPIVYGIVIKRIGKEEEFQRSLFLMVLCFFLSYLGYILLPALGPRYTIRHLQTVGLSGLFLANPIYELLDRLEGIKRDAFPSGHTAVAVLVLFLSFRYVRRLFWLLLPVVSLLLISTVYCRYHYVVDIIAGMGLTVLTVLIGERYYDFHMRMRQDT